MLLDDGGFVTFANLSCERLLNKSRHEIIGRHISAILPVRAQDKFLETMLINGAVPLSIQQFPLHNARQKVIGRMLLLRSDSDTEMYPAARSISRDITTRLMQRLMRIEPQGMEPMEILQAILDAICGETGWPVGHVFVPSVEDPELLVSADVWNLREERFERFKQITRGVGFRAGEGLPGRAMEHMRPVWMADVNLDSAFMRVALTTEIGLHAGFAFPAYVRGRLAAVLEFFDVKTLRPDPVFLAAVESIAQYIGLLLDHRKQRQEMDEWIYSDALTGAGNRRQFDNTLETAYELSKKGMECVLCLFDMDYFKTVNDRFGHAEGDRVLIETVRLVRQRLRARDVLARVGGEEFAIVMFSTTLVDARRVAESLRASIESGIALSGTKETTSASFGLALVDVNKDPDGVATLSRADSALYIAKYSGRNRIVVSE